MSNRTWPRIVAVCILGTAVLSACGKKEESAPARDTRGAATDSAGSTPAPGGDERVTTANAPFAAQIVAKGWTVVRAGRFPSQVDGRRGYAVVYRSGDGKRGGVLYARQFVEENPVAAWHWYFDSAAPDSIQAVDISRDGLWDVRIHAGAGVTEFVQDRDFTFSGPDRVALVAHNGDSSAPADLWRVYDGDTASTWTSPATDAHIDVPNPFGLERGELSVRLAGKDRPTKIALFDGGNRAQEFDLESTTQEQRFVLDAALKNAAVIRVRLEGPGPRLSLSEMEIR